MVTKKVTESIKVVGLLVRTNNMQAIQIIPALWQKFYSESMPEKITNKASDSVYALYTDFENEGIDNKGQYSFLIGMEVKDFSDIPDGLSKAVIPSSNYYQFDIERGKPEKVFEKWKEIWDMTDLENTYKCDFERYQSSGEIAIYIGTQS